MPALDRDQRIQTTCLLILSGVALALSLYWLKGVMIPFVLSVFLSFAFAPLIDVLIRRARFPRTLALLATLAIALTSMVLVGGMVSSSVRGLTGNLERYESSIVSMLEKGAAVLHLEQFQSTLEELSRVEESITDEEGVDAGPSGDAPGSAGVDGAQSAEDGVETAETGPGRTGDEDAVASLVTAIGRRIAPAIGNVLNGITALLSKSILVMIFLMFFLGGRKNFDIRDNETTLGIVERQVRTYLLTKIIASLATGILTAIALRLIGVPNAMLFGLLAFLLNFIPSIGSIIAAVLPLPMALITFDLETSQGVMSVILTLVVPGGIQFLIGNVIEPKVMGDSLDLHPVVVMLSLIFWGTIWGPVGMLLATPITAVIKMMLEKLEPTRPIARAMSGDLGT